MATAIFAVLVGLVFGWFGVVDGILDHVFTAVGLEHMTLLPGGEVELVATVYRLGDAASSAAMLGFAAAFVVARVAAKRRQVEP